MRQSQCFQEELSRSRDISGQLSGVRLVTCPDELPDHDIAITFTGLRPGEKLAEELVGIDERPEPSPVPNIVRVRWVHSGHEEAFRDGVRRLEWLALDGRPDDTVRQLQALVPAFTPDPAVHTIPSTYAVPAAVEIAREERRRSPFSDRRKERRGGRRWYDIVGQPDVASPAPAHLPS